MVEEYPTNQPKRCLWREVPSGNSLQLGDRDAETRGTTVAPLLQLCGGSLLAGHSILVAPLLMCLMSTREACFPLIFQTA